MLVPSRLSPSMLAVGLFALLPVSTFATPVSGTFDISGSNATVTALSLSFMCNPSIVVAPCPAPAPDNGNFLMTASTGSFTGATGGYLGNLAQTAMPPGPPFSPTFTSWITFTGLPDVRLDLNQIFLGSSGQAACGAPPAPGQICTPQIPALVTPANPQGLSPYNLQNSGPPGGPVVGSTAQLSLAGNATRISTGEMSAFTGIFTAQFNVPYQTLLSQIAAGTPIMNSYSATFQTTSVIPEPATTSFMIGGALLLLGMAFRRASHKR